MMRFVPLVCLGVFLGIGVGWRAWYRRRRFGATGIALFRSGRAEQHVRDALLVLLLLIGLYGSSSKAVPHPTTRWATVQGPEPP